MFAGFVCVWIVFCVRCLGGFAICRVFLVGWFLVCAFAFRCFWCGFQDSFAGWFWFGLGGCGVGVVLVLCVRCVVWGNSGVAGDDSWRAFVCCDFGFAWGWYNIDFSGVLLVSIARCCLCGMCVVLGWVSAV